VHGDGKRIGLGFSILTFLAGTGFAQGTLDCGKYSTVSTDQGTVCRRSGILPWFVGNPGVWDTELRLGAAASTVRFSFVSSLSLTYFDVNLVLEDSEFGSTIFESLNRLDLPRYGSHWTRILGVCHALAGACPTESVTGAIEVPADAPSAAALDGVTAFGVYRYSSNGLVTSQATAPVLLLDQIGARWSALVLETPRDQQGRPGAEITSFAVANLSPDPQAVLIRVYDERGNLSASAKTAVLNQGSFSDSQVFAGGIYADTLANVLGINLPASSCSGCANPPVFRGTVVFEGEKSSPIAPVVFRFNGSAMTTVPVKAE
jgi:hypothetical protein